MNAELEKAMPALIEHWANETNQPMPPNGRYHYSFLSFYEWLRRRHPTYTLFRAGLDPRYPIETIFNRLTKKSAQPE
jgi:hypothetical protein